MLDEQLPAGGDLFHGMEANDPRGILFRFENKWQQDSQKSVHCGVMERKADL